MKQYTAWIVKVHTEKVGLDIGSFATFEEADKVAEGIVQQLSEGKTPTINGDQPLEFDWEEDDQTFEVDDIVEEE